MGYFDDDNNVEQYLQMCEGYDGRALIEIFGRHVAAGSTVLELGMGPGTDLDLLVEAGFAATGSDMAEPFLRRYRERNGTAPTVQLDACTIDTDQRFDAIFSNKVLQHVTRAQFTQSLARQVECVHPGGILMHTLWYGTNDEEHYGMRFTQYDEVLLAAAIPDGITIVEQARYTEMAADDSLWAVLRVEG